VRAEEVNIIHKYQEAINIMEPAEATALAERRSMDGLPKYGGGYYPRSDHHPNTVDNPTTPAYGMTLSIIG
jgi:hypothetical protein